MFPTYTQESHFNVVVALPQLACTVLFLTNPWWLNSGLHQGNPGKFRNLAPPQQIPETGGIKQLQQGTPFSLELQHNIFLLEACRAGKKMQNYFWSLMQFLITETLSSIKTATGRILPLTYTKVLKTPQKKNPKIHNRQKVYYSAINGAYQVSRNNYQLKRLQSFSLLKCQLPCHPWNTFNSSSQQLIRAKTPKGQSFISLILASKQVVRLGRKKEKQFYIFLPFLVLQFSSILGKDSEVCTKTQAGVDWN